MPTTAILEIVNKDIVRCEEAQKQKEGSKCLYQELIAKYSTFYPKFKSEIPTGGKIAAAGSEFDYREELWSIKAKLETFLAAGFEFELPKSETESSPYINVELDNRNEVNMTINITFNEVRDQIQNMSALSDEQAHEIILKINKLEEIIKSSEKKTTKWSRAKEILKWVADKGVDVGIALLPLFLKIT